MNEFLNLVADGLNVEFTPCPEYLRVTSCQKPKKDYLHDDPAGTPPEASTAILLEGVIKSRKKILSHLFNEVTDALAEEGISSRESTITTQMIRAAFESHLSNRKLHDLIKEEDVELPAYCASWKEVAWRLTQQLLAYGYGNKDTREHNPLFEYGEWLNHFITIPEKVIKNQGI